MINPEQLETLSPFDTSQLLIEVAKINHHTQAVVNAGRGNPNWLQISTRAAFARLLTFALDVAQAQGDFGMVVAGDLTVQWRNFQTVAATDQFLAACFQYCETTLGLSRSNVLLDFVNGILGDFYPEPNRCLESVESILAAYITKISRATELPDLTIFPTEGGSAAIGYLFQALKENFLLKSGDKIALSTPIFTPYLEIPELNDFEFIELNLQASETTEYEVTLEQIKQLCNPEIKAFFLINPSNPGCRPLSAAVLQALATVVAQRPDLILITDDVYAAFSESYQSVLQVAPQNTLFVYSFSKLYGATGWRLGLIATAKANVFDRLIHELPQEQRTRLAERYGLIAIEPEKFPFIDRIVADSRFVAMHHTAGLSTPQQIQMALFALGTLTDTTQTYVQNARTLIHHRYQLFYEALGVAMPPISDQTFYYTLVDIYQLAEQKYTCDFADYLRQTTDTIQFEFNLAKEEDVVVMNGPGFDAPVGTIRISLANLPDTDYCYIGQKISELLAKYHARFLESCI